MPFEHPITARFHEVDRAGIVFFGRAFEYAHICYEEMLIAAFDDAEVVMGARRFVMPIVHAEADYQRPIRQFDRLVAALDLERLSKRSMTSRITLRGAADPTDVRVVVRRKQAFVNAENFTGMERPAFIDAGFARIGLVAEEIV